MFEELDRLINFIQKEYIEFNEKWKQSDYYYKFNLKNIFYQKLNVLN